MSKETTSIRGFVVAWGDDSVTPKPKTPPVVIEQPKRPVSINGVSNPSRAPRARETSPTSMRGDRAE